MVGADGDGGAGDSSVESPPGPGHRGRPPPGALRPTTPTTQPPRQSCRAPRFSRETEGICTYVAFLLTTEAEKAQRLQAASRGPRS